MRSTVEAAIEAFVGELRGQHIRRGDVTLADWPQAVVPLLCHDIGDVRGICRRDHVLV